MTKLINIPGTGLNLCPIGLGTAAAGLRWADADADRLLDAFVHLGGNLIDTARVYSDWVPGEIGRSERVIGDWLVRSGKRNQVLISTKGGHPIFRKPTDDLHRARMTRPDMREDIELSLKTLRIDTIDLYFFHRDNPAQSVAEEIDTMEDFRREGKIRYYACSNWSAERMQAADAYAMAKGYRGFVANQALFNLGMRHMKPLADDTLVCLDHNLFQYHVENPRNLAMPFMGLANGFFNYCLAKGPDAVKDSPYCTPANLQLALRCQQIAQLYNATITQVVLGFFAVQPFACAPLYGALNVEQLTDAMGTLKFDFKKSDFEI